MGKGNKDDKALDLRRRAERAHRKKKKFDLENLSEEERHRVIHELEVHQIELEMQNEELRHAHVEIEKSRSQYADLYDFAPLGYFTFDAKGLITGANLSGAQLLHTERKSLIHKPFSSFVHKKDMGTFFLHVKNVLEKRARQKCQVILELKPHSHKIIQQYVEMESIPAEDETGSFRLVRTALSDITGRKLLEEKLVRASEDWERTFDIMPDLIMIIDNQYRIIKSNKALAKQVGVTREELIGQVCYKVMHGREDPPSYCPHSKVMSGGKERFEEIYEDHLKAHYLLSSTPVHDTDGNQSGVIEVFRDITARKEMEEQLKVTVITDDLTGLLNRRGFFTLAEQQCKIADRKNTGISLLYLDIDNMKAINDTHGHKEGDQVLRDASRVIKSTFRGADIISRIGGDEFAVLLTEPSGPDIEDVLCNHIRDNVRAFNEKVDRVYDLSISPGFASSDQTGSCSLEDLLRRADSSMYKNKKNNSEKEVPAALKDASAGKRKFERCEAPDDCWADISESYKVRVKNISLGGARLTNMHHLMTVTGRFQSMIINCAHERIPVRGVMVWSKLMDEDFYDAGVKFIGLTDRDSESLVKIVSPESR